MHDIFLTGTDKGDIRILGVAPEDADRQDYHIEGPFHEGSHIVTMEKLHTELFRLFGHIVFVYCHHIGIFGHRLGHVLSKLTKPNDADAQLLSCRGCHFSNSL